MLTTKNGRRRAAAPSTSCSRPSPPSRPAPALQARHGPAAAFRRLGRLGRLCRAAQIQARRRPGPWRAWRAGPGLDGGLGREQLVDGAAARLRPFFVVNNNQAPARSARLQRGTMNSLLLVSVSFQRPTRSTAHDSPLTDGGGGLGGPGSRTRPPPRGHDQGGSGGGGSPE